MNAGFIKQLAETLRDDFGGFAPPPDPSEQIGFPLSHSQRSLG